VNLAIRTPRTPEDLLRTTDETLGVLIENLTGTKPRLDVVRQWHLMPPLAPWLTPPFSAESRVLGRCTSYRRGDVDLSRNVAYVDLERVDPRIAADLESGRVNLGELFLDRAIVKHDFRFGTDEEADDFDLVLRSGFSDDEHDRTYVWRKYYASNEHGIAFVVIETLPLFAWEAFLPQRAEATRRSRLSSAEQAASHPSATRYNATVDILERNLREGRGASPYLVTAERTWSYDEVSAGADAAGAGLLDAGLHPGDRLLIALKDRPEFVLTFWGAVKAGLVPVPLAQGLTASDIHFVLADSEARLIVCDDSSAASVREAMQGEEVAALIVGAPPEAPFEAWEDVCARPQGLAAAPTTEDDIALWIYTSGTTGQPKAVMHRHRSIRAGAEHGIGAQVIGLAPSDVVLSVSKMFFAYGLGNSIYQPAAAGASVVLNPHPGYPSFVQGLLDQTEPTVLLAVPAFFAPFTHDPESRLPASVRIAFSAGESLRPALLAAFQERFGIPLLDGLGSTEALHHVTCNRPDDVFSGSAGRPLDGYEIRALDADGVEVPEGDMGELWVRGPTTFAGYWRRPELTSRAYRDGWMRTGDAVRILGGRLFHEGRLDDLMKLGGIWVVPAEIEDVLRTHPDVEDAAVIAVEDDIGVATLLAYVVSPRDDDRLGQEVARHCRGRLASYKIPRTFERVDELPRTVTGKLRRFVLRSGVRGPETDAD
jgi:benzoate-CoA ligase